MSGSTTADVPRRIAWKDFRLFRVADDWNKTASPAWIAAKLPEVDEIVLNDTLRSCLDSCIISVHAAQYAEIIVNDWRRRQAQTILNRVDLRGDALQKIGQLINQLDNLRKNAAQPVDSMAAIVESEAPQHFTVRDGGLQMGFKRLDGILGGVEGGDILTLAARPGVGKSALVTQIALQVAEQGKRVVLFSLEMSRRQIYERMVSYLPGITLGRVRNAKCFLNDEEAKFRDANSKLKSYDIWMGEGSKTVGKIRNESRNLGASLIIVDYVQLIRSEQRYSNRAAEIGAISKALKSLAVELQVPMLLLSQVNRMSEMRPNKEPSMSELRESGNLEQDSSIVALLWNVDENSQSKKALKIAKNRQGSCGKIYLEFDGAKMRFSEVDKSEADGWRKVTKKDEIPIWND